MDKYFQLTQADRKLLEIVWKAEPVTSPDLTRIALDELGWKRTTTYTVLKRLSEKEMLKSEDTIVTSLIDQEKFQEIESQKVLDQSFEGSLPKFVASFLSGRKISDKEISELKRLIDEYRKDL
jgi:predicted transcriptional regulator